MTRRLHPCGRPRRRAWLRLGGAALGAGLLGLGALDLAARWAPFPAERLAAYPGAAVLTDRAGQPLRVWLGAQDLDCRPGYQPDPAHWIVQALVAAEDRRFWSHPGLDLAALARAAAQNLLARRTVSGASTLSTQVIRLIEPRPRHLGTKCIEAFRALQLERRLDKRAILAQWLDRAPFGGNIVGIEAAACRYFGKRAADLSLAEAALLAGVPQSPARNRPDRQTPRARARQAYVLERMAACGFITSAQQAEARAQPLAVRDAGYPFRAPHFTSWIGAPGREPGTAALRTTLDYALQQRAESALNRHAQRAGARGGAVVILDVRTGAVRAMVGSPDFAARPAGQVNGALAPRAAGSTLKPFVYALALDRGLMTPLTVLADAPILFPDYVPRNFEPAFRGWVTLHDALVLSLNLPAIEVERRVGQPLYYAALRALGLATLSQPASHYGLGLVLGNAEVRLLDLANAYACLARGGTVRPVHALETPEPGPARRVFSEEACWLIADLLSGDERAMDTTGHTADVRLPRMAWKTGTSAGLRDAWTLAYNPEFVIGVWLGNPDGAGSDRLVGREAATPLAWDLFRGLYPDGQSPWYERPAGVTPRAVCAASGGVPGPTCPHRVQDWAIARVSRHMPCWLHRGRPDAPAWPPAPAVAGLPARPARSLRIVSPASGSAYRRLEGFGAAAQRLALSAVSDVPEETLHWFVDNRPAGCSRPGEPCFWPLARGAHQIVCATARGASDRIRITVD